MKFILNFIIIIFNTPIYYSQDSLWTKLSNDFYVEYQNLNIPSFEYSYKNNFKNIISNEHLTNQEYFFNKIKSDITQIDPKFLTNGNQISYQHLLYEVNLNLQRIKAEKKFIEGKFTIPENGLSSLPPEAYDYYIKFFTSIDVSPEQLFLFGEQEVEKVSDEIKKIQKDLSFDNDSAGFYNYISSNKFVLTDLADILRRYNQIDSTVRQNLHNLFITMDVNKIRLSTWPDAGPFTPPGYYQPANSSNNNSATFYFNFYNNRHNTRSMEWIYMHEAIPGHHYQWNIRNAVSEEPDFKELFYYPGNFEGWAAYVEYLGGDLGLYHDPFSYLGKWEWDLVRSVRILIDVGIHSKGWTKEEAIAYWKKYVPGQDEIAEREVTRCTNWPGQALSYKVGAAKIMEIIIELKKHEKEKFDIRKFHHEFLNLGSIPMEVAEYYFLNITHHNNLN